MKPSWQRCRITYQGKTVECWAKINSRAIRDGVSLHTREPAPNFDGVVINVQENHLFLHVAVKAEFVEMLARSKADFAEDVPMLSVKEWTGAFE